MRFLMILLIIAIWLFVALPVTTVLVYFSYASVYEYFMSPVSEEMQESLTLSYNKIANELGVPELPKEGEWRFDLDSKPYNKNSGWDKAVYFHSPSLHIWCFLYLKTDNENFKVNHGRYSVDKGISNGPEIRYDFDLNSDEYLKRCRIQRLSIEYFDVNNGIYNKVMTKEEAYKLIKEWYPAEF